MNINMKKTSFWAIIATVFAVIVFTWFDTRVGLQGCFNWHILIRTINIILFFTIILPAIFGFLAKFVPNKFTRTLSYIVSIFVIVLWFGVFCFLSILSNYRHDNSGLNLLAQNEPIPTASLPAQGEPITHIAVASDPHWGASTRNEQACVNILKQIESRNYDAFYLLGDVADFGIFPSGYKAAIKDLRENLKNTKYRIIPGNHDALVNGMPAFKSTFMSKKDKLWFRMDAGKIHFIFINMLWDESELTRREEKWLVNQLESIPKEDTVVVFSHCYIVSSGYYDPAAEKNWGDLHNVMDILCPLFEKYDVDLHISGHDHFFEYLEKDDCSYCVVGTMGGKLDENLIYSSPYSKWLNNTDFGWLDMKIYDDLIELEFFDQYGTSLHKTVLK